MEKLYNAKQMKFIDEITIKECGLVAEVLMERAALEVVNNIEKREGKECRVLVVCGSGNNGGDGICVARILKDRGYRVMLSLIGNEDKASNLYRENKLIAIKWGIEFYNIIPNDEYDVIVDAIFGIGLNRDVDGKYMDAINKINSVKECMTRKGKKCHIYAVDMPSGIGTDNGNVLGAAVKCDYTITFGNKKIGQVISPGCEYCGELTVADIGFYPGVYVDNTDEDEIYTLGTEDLDNILPLRPSDSNKGDYGKILVVAGSVNMAGAAVLCAHAAIKAGAGLVKIFTCESNRTIIQTALPEAILCTYPDDWYKDVVSVNEFKSNFVRELSWANMVVAGPGISTGEGAVNLMKYLCRYITCPLLLDADALNIISEQPDFAVPTGAIVTPHVMEMSRLCGKTVTTIKESLIEVAKEYANDNNVIVVLKDSKTVVTDGKKVYINSTGNNGLSTGGSGDVLAGIIASFAAQGLDAMQSGVSGVFVHGLAADNYAKVHRMFSLTPRDLIEEIGKI